MNETTEDVHGLAAAYALNAVDDSERDSFEAHLATCAQCQDVVRECTDTASLFSEGHEVEPPPELRVRVMDLIAAEAGSRASTNSEDASPEEHSATVSSLQERRERKIAPLHRWLTGVAAAGIVAVGVWGATQGFGPDPIEQIVSAEDAAEYTADSDSGTVSVVTSPAADRAVLQLPPSMPAPSTGSVYQAWFVHSDGTAVSAGVLSEDAFDDQADLLDGSPEGAVAVGLTVEPAGGSDEPTTEPFVVVPLG